MASEERFNKITVLLSRTNTASYLDKGTFLQYEEGEIGLDECIKAFRSNNHIRNDVEINKQDFADWLRSLGYIREAYVHGERLYNESN